LLSYLIISYVTHNYIGKRAERSISKLLENYTYESCENKCFV